MSKDTSRKLSRKRLEKGIVADSYGKANLRLSGTQAVFGTLLGAKNPLSKPEIIRRVVRSKAGKDAFESYKGTRFYKTADTLEAYSTRRVGKLIGYGLKPSDVEYPLISGDPKAGYTLTSVYEIALLKAIGSIA